MKLLKDIANWKNPLEETNDDDAPSQLIVEITRNINRVFNGELPDSVNKIWSRARICLIPKKSGHRPISIKCVWYRLLSKMMLSQISDKAKCVLAPDAVGVGIKGAIEVVIDMVSKASERIVHEGSGQFEENSFIISFDIKNCFNMVSTTSIYDQLKDICPEAVRFFKSMYGAPNDLIMNGSKVGELSIGVAQGDPLSMLLASFALRRPFQELKDAMIKETDKQRAKGLKQLDLIHISYADDSYYCT